MKPRERLPQAQTSNMLLRTKAHRDCIYNDTYHNAIWMRKVQDGIEKDELVWMKYPKNYLISGTTEVQTLGYLDTDRQFQHQLPFGTNQRTGFVHRLNGFAVALSSYYSIDYTYVSKDGAQWKRLSSNPTLDNVRCNVFGKEGLCYCTGSSVQINIFVEDEDGNFTIEKSVVNLAVGGCRYLCSTQDGCICCKEESYSIQVGLGVQTRYRVTMYHVTVDGAEQVYFEDSRRYSLFGYPRECTSGNKAGFVVASYYRYYYDNRIEYDTFRNSYYAYTTTDNGHTWEVTELSFRNSDFYRSQSYVVDKCDSCVRDGNMVAVLCDGVTKELKVFKNTGTWEQIILPSWVDVPVLQGGGKCIAQSPSYETLRIAIRPSETEDANVNCHDLLRTIYQVQFNYDMNDGLNNILCQDGEIVEPNEFLLLGFDGSIKVYFDNLQFIASSKSFAYYPASYDSTNGADTIQPYDYCV